MNSTKTNRTKTLLAAALIAACTISQPALAADMTESATLPALNTLALESTDLNFAFEQTTQPLQMATLSGQEMQETEGTALPIAFLYYYYGGSASLLAMRMFQTSAYMPFNHAINGVQSWWANR